MSEARQVPPDTSERGSESVEALVGHAVVPEPSAAAAWNRDTAAAAKRSPLRLYLGAAPGVGKTYAMLSEGRRRADRGARVVVACVETYGRPNTISMLEGLEIVPPIVRPYRGTEFPELDTRGVQARHPDVALVDELAHTNVPGGPPSKRGGDGLDQRADGIEVISTINVQHLESLNDVVADATGIRQRETVPDWVVDLADQIELVDMSPYALRRRMLHGNVYPDQRKAELALQRFFTTDNLTALRELALMRVANQVDETLLSRWTKTAAPETRERILVCISHPSFSEELVRRGARIAQRSRGELLVLHMRERMEEEIASWLEEMRRLTEDLGGQFHVIDADDGPEAVLGFAYRQFVTQIVVGEPLRSRWKQLVRGSFVNDVIRKARNIDIHVMARRERDERPR